jgi:hypothetical protein
VRPRSGIQPLLQTPPLVVACLEQSASGCLHVGDLVPELGAEPDVGRREPHHRGERRDDPGVVEAPGVVHDDGERLAVLLDRRDGPARAQRGDREGAPISRRVPVTVRQAVGHLQGRVVERCRKRVL